MCIKEYKNENKEANNIPIWMLIETMTFGEVVYFYEQMSLNNRKEIAFDFYCEMEEFISGIKCLKFIRNRCTHNLNVIDLKLKTKPKLKEEWKKWLIIDKNNQTSGKLADVLIPMVYLTITINDKFVFNDLQRCVNKLVHKDKFKANMLGFKDIKSSQEFIKLLNGKFKEKKQIISCNKKNTINKFRFTI